MDHHSFLLHVIELATRTTCSVTRPKPVVQPPLTIVVRKHHAIVARSAATIAARFSDPFPFGTGEVTYRIHRDTRLRGAGWRGRRR